MHIGIYINNENISSVDCKNLLVGNPGIGGTEYCVLLLAQAYKMYYSNNKVTLFVAKQGILPEVDNYVVVNGIDDLPAKGTAYRQGVGCGRSSRQCRAETAAAGSEVPSGDGIGAVDTL